MNHLDRNQDELAELLRQIAGQTARAEKKKRRDLAKLVWLHDLVAIDIWPACWHLIRPRSEIEEWSQRTIEARRAEFADIAEMLAYATSRYRSSGDPDVFSGDRPVEVFGGLSTSYHQAAIGLGLGVVNAFADTRDDPSQEKFIHAIRCFSVVPNLGGGRFPWDSKPLSAPFDQREGMSLADCQVPEVNDLQAMYQWEAPGPGMVDAALVIEYTRAMRRLGVEFPEPATPVEDAHGSCWFYPRHRANPDNLLNHEAIRRAVISQFAKERTAHNPSSFFRNLCFLLWSLEGLGPKEVAKRWNCFGECTQKVGLNGEDNLVKQAIGRVRKHLDIPAIGKLTPEQREGLHDLLAFQLRQQCVPEHSARLFPMRSVGRRGHGQIRSLPG